MELASWSNAASIARVLCPMPTSRKSQKGIKFDFPPCRFTQGREEKEGAAPLGFRIALRGTVPSSMALPLLTQTQGSRGNSGHPNPPGGGGKGDNLNSAQLGSNGAELLRKKEGGTEMGAGRGEVQVPSLPRPGVPGPAGTSQPSPLLLLLLPASSALPFFLVAAAGAWRARRLLGARQPRERLRVEVTPRLPRRPACRRLPHASTAPPSPEPPGALAHRPVVLLLPVAADAQSGEAARSQRSAAAGAPAAAAPGGEEQQERSTCGGRHLSTGNGADPGIAADGRGGAKARHSPAPAQLPPWTELMRRGFVQGPIDRRENHTRDCLSLPELPIVGHSQLRANSREPVIGTLTP